MLSRAVFYFWQFLSYMLLIRAITSWFVNANTYSHPIVRYIYQMSDPILEPMRNLFDRYNLNRGMFDLSFLATYFAIDIIARMLITILGRIGL